MVDQKSRLKNLYKSIKLNKELIILYFLCLIKSQKILLANTPKSILKQNFSLVLQNFLLKACLILCLIFSKKLKKMIINILIFLWVEI